VPLALVRAARPEAIRFALYSFIALALGVSTALAGMFPFGAAPRHTVVLLPGMLVACVFGAARLVALIGKTPRARALASALFVIALSPGFMIGLARLRQARANYDLALFGPIQAQQQQQPGPWVGNWRGRTLLSWWFLAGRPSRRTDHHEQSQVFDYAGIKVVETAEPEAIAKTASSLVQQHGRCSILFAFFAPDTASVTPRLERMVAGLRNDPSLVVEVVQWGTLDIPVLLLHLSRAVHSRPHEEAPRFQGGRRKTKGIGTYRI
jgi:hypothetical protein